MRDERNGSSRMIKLTIVILICVLRVITLFNILKISIKKLSRIFCKLKFKKGIQFKKFANCCRRFGQGLGN